MRKASNLELEKQKTITAETRITELLSRGVEDVTVREHLQAALKSGKKLRVKHGIDPTGPKIHIGRAIALWKLRAFQNLGHKIVLIIGDTTAQIGDPSDKLHKRPFLTSAQVKANLKGYLAQIGKVLDLKKCEVRKNSEWLAKLTFLEGAQLAESFSAQQMLARRNFKARWDAQEDISVRELLYPLMQGYDSVAVKADIEIGGTDQLFNLHAGRTIQQHYKQPPQDILTLKMLEGSDGRKMSTSWGNVINITDEPNNMYGKIMAMDDAMMPKYFDLACPHLAYSEVERIMSALGNGSFSPRDAKMRLAREIVTLYHGASKAMEAEKEFVRVFQKKEAPQDMPEILLPLTSSNSGPIMTGISDHAKIILTQPEFREFTIVDLLMSTGKIDSRNEAKRLTEQGGVELDGKVETDPRKNLLIKDGVILRVGKRIFFRLRKPK